MLLLFVVAGAANAQKTITGRVVESETKEALMMATVKLMKTDSTLVKGAVTAEDGSFKLEAPDKGRFILSISNLGHKSYTRTIEMQGKDIALGAIAMTADTKLLKEVKVEGHMAKVVLREDTFVYNAGAYRTPEGSVIEELVKKLPGAQVSDDGTVKINGKEVKKILVDGKEFMTGDTKTAMKNLPTSIVEKVKAYDQKSDLARVSGIDDGDESTVLDFGIKKGMNRGFFTNNDIAAGTHDRYSARLMGASMNDNMRLMGFANANNTNDMGFGWGRGGGRQGLQASKMVGVNMNWEKKDRLTIDGSVRWNHSDGDTYTKTSSENFVSRNGSFTNSESQNFSRSNSWNAQMRLEWTPDTMTNIMFRPNFSYNSNDGLNGRNNATFTEDPYLYTADPLRSIEQLLLNDSLMVNHRNNHSISYNDNYSIGGSLQYNRKIGSKGRNLTVRMQANYKDNTRKNMAANLVELFQKKNYLGNDSTYQTNRYNLTPEKNYSYSARFTYSEPIAKATFLQFSYEFQYKYNKSDRSTYDFTQIDMQGVNPRYRSFDDYFNNLSDHYTAYESDSLSRFSEYKNYIHNIDIMLRVIRKAYNLNVGLTLVPQTTNFVQHYLGHNVDTKRTVTNFTPTANFRWKISKVSQLRFDYRGSTSQPSMTDLLDITDSSDPLNISTGNPGLKPSFNNRFYLFYNNYIEKRQQAMMAHLNFSTTRNSISQKVTYNPETGGRLTRPENINGNWDISGTVMYNTAIDTAGYFNINTTTSVNYQHHVGYLSPDRYADSQKNITRNTSVSERLAMSYRNDWIEFEPNGEFNYNHSTNLLQSASDLDTWSFSYGFNTNIQLPWGMQLNTNLNMNSRRGYNDASLNTNELIWNAQISQSFLKGNALTLSLQFYDLLHEQSNLSRVINAMSRTDTEYNAVTNYAMLHVIYRMNVFGGKAARGGMGPGGPGPRGGNRGGGRGGRGGGRPMGGPMFF